MVVIEHEPLYEETAGAAWEKTLNDAPEKFPQVMIRCRYQLSNGDVLMRERS
jgi:hypothetical protein